MILCCTSIETSKYLLVLSSSYMWHVVNFNLCLKLEVCNLKHLYYSDKYQHRCNYFNQLNLAGGLVIASPNFERFQV